VVPRQDAHPVMKRIYCCLTLLIASTAPLLKGAPVPLVRTAELSAPAGDVAAQFGKTVACNDLYIVVGAPAAALPGGTEQGAVYVYDAKSHRLLRRLRASQPLNGERFGSALALAGPILYVGAPGHSAMAANGGAVHAFDVRTGAPRWTHAGTVAGEKLGGHALAVVADLVAVGMPFSKAGGNPNESGYVRMLSEKTGMYMGYVVAPNTAAGDHCGFALSASGHYLAVGVPMSDIGSSNNGVVLIVDARAMGFPIELVQGPGASGQFGRAVALSGPLLFVSSSSGLRYFDTKAGSQGVIVSVPEGSSSAFGKVLGMTGHVAVFSDAERNPDAKVYGYDLVQGALVWELTDPNAAQSASRFGRSVAISGSQVVVGDGEGLNGVTVANLPVFPWSAQRMKQVISSGETAPGLSARFGAVALAEGAMNAQGEVAALAGLTGSGVTTATRSSLWSDMTGFGLVARTGDELGGQRLTSVDAPILNGPDRALFLARVSGSNAQVLMEDHGASAEELVREGALVGGGRQLGRIFGVVQPMQSGVPAATARFALTGAYRAGPGGVILTSDSAVFTSTSFGSLGELAREGSNSPVMGRGYGQMIPRLARVGNDVVFAAALTGGSTADDAALFKITVGGGSVVLARKGDVAPGLPGGTFRSFLGEAVNPLGRYVFKASVNGAYSGGDEGVWSNIVSSNIMQLMAREGWPAPGLPAGVYFSRFLRCFISGGELVIWAKLSGATVNASNDQGIWRYSLYGPELILREGDPAAGCGGARYGTLQGIDVSMTGQYVIAAGLTGCSAATNQALFEGAISQSVNEWQRQPQLVLRKGTVIDRPGNGTVTGMTLSRKTVDVAGFGTKGLGSIVTYRGPLFGVRYADGTSQLLSGRQ
jgi:outer membrane protein assembly factor BamB